jgi:hypothetical protein
MPVNDFKAFATGENANVLSQEEYEELEALGGGFQSGIARSEQLNKVWRQASIIASVVARFMAEKSGDDVKDDGDLEKLQESLLKALLNNATTQLDGRYLKAVSNLADLTSVEAARGNMELKGAALLDVGTASGTVAAGNDSRIVNAAQRGNNLSDLTDKGVALNNINAVSRVTTINGHALTGNINVTSQDIFNGQAIQIPSGANLNSYQTPGIYFQPANANAAAGSNYPEALAGTLLVLKNAGVTQIYIVYNTSRIYSRSIYSTGSWTGWAKDYNSLNKPSAGDVGALPLGGGTITGSLTVNNTIWAKSAVHIGDNDSGLRANGDGSVALFSNNTKKGYWNTSHFYWQAGQVIPSNYGNFDSRYVQNVQRGAAVSPPKINQYGPGEAPAGCVLTRAWGDPGDNYGVLFTYRPLQIYINGAWRTIGG